MLSTVEPVTGVLIGALIFQETITVNNSNRLLSLINDIIRLSELDHKELPRKFTSVDLKDIAEDCSANLRVSAEKHRIREL